MKKRQTNSSQAVSEMVIPQDLTCWIARDQLLQWIEAGVTALDWQDPEVKELLSGRSAVRAQQLLGLWMFALATGNAEATEIRKSSFLDGGASWCMEDTPPSLEELIAFREQNTDLLEDFLVDLLKRAVMEKYECGLLPLALKRYLKNVAALKVQEAGLVDRAALAA